MDKKLKKLHDDMCVSVSIIMEGMVDNSEKRMKAYMDGRFDRLERRMDSMDVRVTMTDNRLVNLEKRQYNIEEIIRDNTGVVAEKVAEYIRGEKEENGNE